MRWKTAQLSFAIALACLSLSADTVKMAIFQLEPFMMTIPGSGEPGGVVVDYWRDYVAPRLGVTLSVSGPFPIARVQKMLESGEVDVVSQLTKIPERESMFTFPKTPLALITSCLIVRKDDPLTEVTGTSDLYDKKIGFIENAFIPQLLIDARIELELISYTDYREINLKKLLAGRIDAMLDINKDSMLYYLNSSKYRHSVRIIDLPVEKTATYSIFAKTEKGRSLCEAFEKVNAEGYAYGIYWEIYKDYIK
jgi:ABC-type amino acid transport substrate-binding protein